MNVSFHILLCEQEVRRGGTAGGHQLLVRSSRASTTTARALDASDASQTEVMPVSGSTQCLPPVLSRSVAYELLRGRADRIEVPATWRAAHAVFWQHPTSVFAISSLLFLAWCRLQTPLALLDLVGAYASSLQRRPSQPALIPADMSAPLSIKCHVSLC